MAENMIFCYSGAGHCLHMAKEIARVLGDTDIVMMRKKPEVTDATRAKRVGFVFSCMGGGLPGRVEEYVRSVRLAPGSYRFGAEQYAGYIGCGMRRIDSIVGLDYWKGISNHCTAIWLMPHTITRPSTTLEEGTERMVRLARVVGEEVKGMKRTPKPPRRLLNVLESAAFPAINRRVNAAMRVSDDCIGCGTCVRVCPEGNIRLEGGRSVIGRNCIGCMACVQYCPRQAINVGNVTMKRERCPDPGVTVEELTAPVIHVP